MSLSLKMTALEIFLARGGSRGRVQRVRAHFVLDSDDGKQNTSLFSVQGKICWFLFFCFTSSVSGIQSKGQIIRQFTRLHLRGMELANILSEWLRNPGKRTSGSQNRKNFPGGTCPRTPPRILSLWRSFRKSVSIYPNPIRDYRAYFQYRSIP